MNQTKHSSFHPLQMVIILVVMFGLGLLIYLPKLLKNTPPQVSILQSAPECELTQAACIAHDHIEQSNHSKTISLKINNSTIDSITPLEFEVQLLNISADQVMVDLKGRDMYMGINQVMLTKVPNSNNLWRGNITLPACTTGRMTWVSSIITESQGQLTQADFSFDAE